MKWFFYYTNVDNWEISPFLDIPKDYENNWIGPYDTMSECKKVLISTLTEDLDMVRISLRDVRSIRMSDFKEKLDEKDNYTMRRQTKEEYKEMYEDFFTTYKDKDTGTISEDFLWESTGFKPRETGLPKMIYVKPCVRENGPARIVILLDEDKIHEVPIESLALIPIELEPFQWDKRISESDRSLIENYIITNKSALMNHWNDVTCTAGFIDEAKWV